MEDTTVFSMTDSNWKEYKAEVIDIFSVEDYPDYDYIMYSFGDNAGDDVQVNISRVVIKDDGLDLVGIEDEIEWAAVSRAIDEIISTLGGVENAWFIY